MQRTISTRRAARLGSRQYSRYEYSDSADSGSEATESMPSSPPNGPFTPTTKMVSPRATAASAGGMVIEINPSFEPSKKSALADSHPTFAFPKSPLPVVSPRPAVARPVPTAALYEAAVSNQATVYAAFGGQGNDEAYFTELRAVCERHIDLVGDLMLSVSDLLDDLARDERFVDQYPRGFDLAAWLQDSTAEPDRAYLTAAPVSMPLIGFLQLLHFRVLGHELGCSIADMHTLLSGAGGHSQGIVSAAVIAASTTWDEFEEKTLDGMRLLQSMGARAQQVFPPTSLPPSIEADARAAGEGCPTPMLSIQDLPLPEVRKAVAAANKHLGDACIEVALVNGRNSTVVSGPPASLHSLNLKLRAAKAPASANQAKTPFSQRKANFTQRFLPVSAPFHSSHLTGAVDLVAQDIDDIEMTASSLAIPIYSTVDGHDLRTHGRKNIALDLATMILRKPLDWPAASTFSNATTILEFGPGGAGGVAGLTQTNKVGSGVRVICVTAETGSNEQMGYRPSILGMQQPLDNFVRGSWASVFGPQLVHTAPERTIVDTRFSRLLGLPPVMVAAMTPTTSSVDFVIAVMNAGYHVELACGGIRNAEELGTAIKKISSSVTPVRGITINVIYASPHTLRWQIPAIAKLRQDGYPIEGLCVGAGVPSPEVAGEYIRDLGLRHISFKPGSIASIGAVIAIAKAHPTFPVIMQWTGGRGGGHHSYEDFHQPLLEMYGRIRECSNISLVVGSGFGGAEDSLPYLTGAWSVERGYPAMPCDGILMGSRVMVAKEAATSTAAKQAIVDATGVADHQWEQTYKKPTGGILTVISEMGEPIHKIATRAVKFWHELDQTVFNLKKADMLKQLTARRSYIIEKLNADCHKVWFGKDSTGNAVEVDEMTYDELVHRIGELAYISHQDRWINDTFRTLSEDVMTMAQARFSSRTSRVNISGKPSTVAAELVAEYPQMSQQLVTYQDARKFIEMCRRKGQKPVPFVPVLDENFETWFKKDSLWQSEDVDAVYGQDVGRVCILQGPVAAAYSKIVNEPVKNILDAVHVEHVKSLSAQLYSGEADRVPRVECFGISPFDSENIVDAAKSITTGAEHSYTYEFGRVDAENLPAASQMLNTLGGKTNDWRRALFTSEFVMQGAQMSANPVKRIFAPASDTSILVREVGKCTSISLFEHSNDVAHMVAEVSSAGDGSVDLRIVDRHANPANPPSLTLKFQYQPESLMAPFREVMEGRNERIAQFYQHLWFKDEVIPTASTKDTFTCGPISVSSGDVTSFARTIGNLNDAFTKRGNRTVLAPMDFAIVLGWKAIMKPLFTSDLDCDLLKLVHLSNSFDMVEGAEPIREGDSVSTETAVTAIVNQPTGKRVRVEGYLVRDGQKVMKLASEFFVRGSHSDHGISFEKLSQEPMQVTLASVADVAVLKSKKWLELSDSSIDLLGSRLVFTVESTSTFTDAGVSGIKVQGDVELRGEGPMRTHIGRVNFDNATATSNPVVEYLKRHASTVDKTHPLPHSIVAHTQELTFTAPASNEAYAYISGDLNPIHVNGAFARYAELPGTITHGMHTSAIVRGLVEHWVVERDIGLFRSFNANFTGMVLPGDAITVSFEHSAMRHGQKLFTVKATNAADQTVLTGEAVVEPPRTAYVFTGQGSQRQGMGMDLYAESAAARDVWDRVEAHLLKTYGFSILNIVRNNPKELTIHFGGVRGRAIRQNYLNLSLATQDAEGKVINKQLFPSITEDSDSYTFRHTEGLLFATQFTQPSLAVMEKAIFEDLVARGLVSSASSFAGHSLGEFAGLCALGGGGMKLESIVDLAFYRGMSMQSTVPRDIVGRSDYGMCAVDPGRVGKTFSQEQLINVVDIISESTGRLLEIVNYNILNVQYVCAGDIYAIAAMTAVLDKIKKDGTNLAAVPDSRAYIEELVKQWQTTGAPAAGERPVIKRGAATIPLPGIDVPFHSKFLRSSVDSFRHVVDRFVRSGDVEFQHLTHRYVPNLTGKAFEVSKDYLELVHESTGSKVLGSVLSQWPQIVESEKGFDFLSRNVSVMG